MALQIAQRMVGVGGDRSSKLIQRHASQGIDIADVRPGRRCARLAGTIVSSHNGGWDGTAGLACASQCVTGMAPARFREPGIPTTPRTRGTIAVSL